MLRCGYSSWAYAVIILLAERGYWTFIGAEARGLGIEGEGLTGFTEESKPHRVSLIILSVTYHRGLRRWLQFMP